MAVLKGSHTGWILAGLSCLAMLTLFWWEGTRTLPAPLSRVHGEVAELGGMNDCEQCHGTNGQTMSEACVACHEGIGDDLARGRGLHGFVVEGARERCARCHGEHAGRDFALVSDPSFVLAGFEGRAAFDHPWPEYDLNGAHLDLDCVECHALADAPLLREGQERFRGLSRECATCHDDSPHEEGMQRDCSSCHGQTRAFAEVPEFVHDERFPLEGIHDIQSCADCHERGSEHGFERLASFQSPPEVRGCEACHEAPHREGFVSGQAPGPGGLGRSACEHCHGLEHSRWQDAMDHLDPERHGPSGFLLDGPHGEQDCEACHAAELPWEERYPGRDEEHCATCHGDPHGGQFAEDSSFPACADCHDDQRFVPAHFNAQLHSRTDFPLIEGHLAVGCLACHVESTDAETDRVWNGLDATCGSCHGDSHRGAFQQFVARRAEPEEISDCDQCHNSSRFGDEATQQAFEHERWTPFALQGEHKTVECEACHVRGPRDELERTFGRIVEVFGEVPTRDRPCSTCHGDPHGGSFVPEAPRSWQGKFGCARCHDEVDFQHASQAGFEHELWTSRRLGGAHLDLECAACHRRRPVPDEFGRTFGRPAEVFPGDLGRCETCHRDIHGGLFDGDPDRIEIEGRVGCARCHDEEHFLGSLRIEFDHDLWTGTNLQSGHQNQNCQACHPRIPAESRDQRQRAPARGRECIDCHLDPHLGQFRGSTRAECQDCHQDQTSWAEIVFDHDVDSTYPLDATHRDLDCSQCHPSVAFPNGTRAVRYKPLPRECADCHQAPGEDP